MVVEESPHHMTVKRFECTTIHNKALYKCIIQSFTTRVIWKRRRDRASAIWNVEGGKAISLGLESNFYGDLLSICVNAYLSPC